jgi:hypothetical protein
MKVWDLFANCWKKDIKARQRVSSKFKVAIANPQIKAEKKKIHWKNKSRKI